MCVCLLVVIVCITGVGIPVTGPVVKRRRVRGIIRILGSNVVTRKPGMRRFRRGFTS